MGTNYYDVIIIGSGAGGGNVRIVLVVTRESYQSEATS
jgi:hypothetical protein